MQTRRKCHLRSDHGARSLLSTRAQVSCMHSVDMLLCLPVSDFDRQLRGDEFISVEVACGSGVTVRVDQKRSLNEGVRPAVLW
jgi:hypothetical protein